MIEAKTTKTIRDYDTNKTNPFEPSKKKKKGPAKKKKDTISDYLSDDKTLAVSLAGKTGSRKNLTGIHKVSEEESLDLIGDVLKEKLGLTKGGVNMFKYIFNNLEEKRSGGVSMVFKVDFDHCKEQVGWTASQSVWYGLAELLDKSIIARSETPGAYFLNPNFFLPTDTIVIAEFYKLKDKK